jgi:CheY-like chemotaxis protein
MDVNPNVNSGIRTVLLAEDDEDDVLIFRLALNKLSLVLEIKHVSDGIALLNLLRQQVPDIIFLDIRMPGKDGLSCIVEIRKNKEYHHIPVIMYTSFKSERYIDESYSNGANFYVLKADSISQLAEKLKKIFSIDWKNYAYFPPKSEFVLGTI